MFLETREGRRAEARTDPVARDYIRTTDGWRVVSGRHGDRCGMVAHRGVLHPDEYVDVGVLRAMVERKLGFTHAEVRSVYRQGRLSQDQKAFRARIDARVHDVALAGGNVTLLSRVLGFKSDNALAKAVARARACAADTARASCVRSSDNGPARLHPPGPDQREVISMAAQTVTPLDHEAIAAGLGELKQGNGYDRIVVGGKTVAYLKKGRIAVPTALVTKAPKKLGSFTAEKSGSWSNAAVDTTAKARAILEYVVAQGAAQA